MTETAGRSRAGSSVVRAALALAAITGCYDVTEQSSRDAAVITSDDAASLPEDASPPESMEPQDDAARSDAATMGSEEDDAGAAPDAHAPDEAACLIAPVQLHPVEVNVVVSMHRSYLESGSWSALRQALGELLQSTSGDVGAHVFWADVADVDAAAANLNFCGDVHGALREPAAGEAQEVLRWFDAHTPAPTTSIFRLRPLLDGLGHFLVSETLRRSDRVNYLLLISDGADNCFGAPTWGLDTKPVFQELASELRKRQIRVVPIAFEPLPEQAIGSAQLDLLARHGGAGLERAFSARNAEELSAVMASVARAIRPCRYGLRASAAVPLRDQLALHVDGRAVARDRTRVEGWDFVDGGDDQIEIFGQACAAIGAGAVASAHLDCSASDLCGSPAAHVERHRRSVLFMLDASSSMLACLEPGQTQDEVLQCLTGQIPTWWATTAGAIADVLVDPVNHSIDFALRAFPAQDGDGCGGPNVRRPAQQLAA